MVPSSRTENPTLPDHGGRSQPTRCVPSSGPGQMGYRGQGSFMVSSFVLPCQRWPSRQVGKSGRALIQQGGMFRLSQLCPAPACPHLALIRRRCWPAAHASKAPSALTCWGACPPAGGPVPCTSTSLPHGDLMAHAAFEPEATVNWTTS